MRAAVIGSALKRHELKIIMLFLLLLAVYLFIAWSVYAPQGYYGEGGKPDLHDPWVQRSETIISGGVLYRDVFTTTPPLTNYLIVVPTLFAKASGYVDPWTTLSFMLYFSLFCLLGAFVLFYLGGTKQAGWQAAALFLLNPATFGAAILKRQDESILVFFVGLALFYIVRNEHIKGALGIAAAMLIKLGAIVLIPITLLHKKSWKYLVIPLVVCAVAFTPFLILAGKDAMIWDTGQKDYAHFFQFGGVSLAYMYNHMHRAEIIDIQLASWILLIGLVIALVPVCWKRFGVLTDVTILLTAALVFSPKMHAGYLCLLAFTMAPLIKKKWMIAPYLLFGLMAMFADYFKYPVRNYTAAFWLMAGVAVLLIALSVIFALQAKRNETKSLT